MIDCLIIGDQIADGMTDHIKGCALIAEPNKNIEEFWSEHSRSRLIYNNDWDMVIICLGINERNYYRHTVDTLRELRNGIRAKDVYWLLPPESMFDMRNAVHDAAMGRQDMIIEVAGWNKNTLSPRGYREAASKIR